jgi:hypothetical protein
MGKRAERRARRQEKVVSYAQRINKGVQKSLDTEETTQKLAIASLRGGDHWDLAFAEVVGTPVKAEIKACPQEKELILDGMRHYLDVLFRECDKDRARRKSEEDGAKMREEEAEKRKKDAAAAKKKSAASKKKEATAAA